MTLNNIAEWYFILGIITTIIGVYRGLRNKQTVEPDELTVFSWFILWWIWLPWLGYRLFVTKILKKA